MLRLNNIIHIISKLLTAKGGLSALTSAITAYIFLSLINNASLITTHIISFNFSFLSSIIPPLVTSYPGTVHNSTLAITILTSMMIGLNVGLLVETLSFEGLMATPGTVLGLTVSGCAACTTGVMTLAGISIGVSFLPFQGLEISIIGLALLSISALYISEKDRKKVCNV